MHTDSLQCWTIQLSQPTVAWLIAAPPPNNALMHSTWPSWLAMYSGVAPSICNTTRHTMRTPRLHAQPHHLCYTFTCATADDRYDFHPLQKATGKLRKHVCRLPQIPAHTATEESIKTAWTLLQPTIAWLITAPPPINARTHSTRPSWLAMYSGVAPSVCTPHGANTTHLFTQNTHLLCLPSSPLWYVYFTPSTTGARPHFAETHNNSSYLAFQYNRRDALAHSVSQVPTHTAPTMRCIQLA
jgi:hypothetical protein